MLRKFMAIILSMVMLFSAAGVFAAVDTTSEPGKTIYTDDFSQYTSNITVGSAGYPNGTQTSDVFVARSGSGGNIVTGVGKDNTTALKILQRTGGNTATQNTRQIDLKNTTAGIIEFKYDIQILVNKNTTSTAVAGLGSFGGYGSGPLFTLEYNTDKWMFKDADGNFDAAYDLNTWYKVVIRQTKTYKYGYILNEAGEIIAQSSKSRTAGNTEQIGAIHFASDSSIDSSNPAAVLIDNAVLTVYDESTVAPKVTTAPSISGATAVATDVSSVTVQLDQPIAASSTATLTATGDSKTCTITEDTTKLYTYTISWEPSLLSGTQYTLDLSNLKNSTGTTAGDSAKYTFETAEAEIVADLVSSNPVNGADGVSVETKSMTVTFNKEMTAPESVSLTGGSAAITAFVTTTDNETFILTWTNDLEGNTTYTVSLADFVDAGGATAETASVSFKTENTGIVKLADSFESESVVSKGTGYNTDGDTSVSPLKMAARTTDDTVVEVGLGDGYTSGTRALQLQSGNDTTKKYIGFLKTSEKHSIGANEKLVATWRFCLDNPGSGLKIGIGATNTEYEVGQSKIITRVTVKNGKPVVYYDGNDENTAREISAGKWYNVVYIMSDSQESIYFTDALTGEVVYQRIKQGSNFADNTAAYIHIFNGSTSETDNIGISARVDDFTLWKVDPTKAQHKLALDGEVTGENGTYTMSFNQPVIGTEAMLKVAEVTGSTPAEYNYDIDFAADFNYPDFCTMRVELSDLPFRTECVLDYSGLIAASGVGFAESVSCLTNSFTTGNDTVGTFTLAGNAKYEDNAISFKLYNDGNVAETPQIYVALYKEGELCGIGKPTDVVSVAGKATETVSVSTADYTDFDSVRVFVWNDNLVPLMGVYNRNITVVD